MIGDFSDQNSQMNQSETSLNKQNGFPIVQNSKILRLKLFPLYKKMKINCPGQGGDFSLRLTTTLTKLGTFWGRNCKIFAPTAQFAATKIQYNLAVSGPPKPCQTLSSWFINGFWGQPGSSNTRDANFCVWEGMNRLVEPLPHAPHPSQRHQELPQGSP